MSRQNLKINASFVEYGSPNHKLLQNYSFKFTNEEKTFLEIKKPNGDVVESLKIGDNLSDIGAISLDEAGDLIVGKYKIYQGENMIPGWSAKRSKGKTVKITDPQGKEHNGTVGEYFKPLNGFISGKDEFGNLSFNDGQYTMKHLTKTKTVSLTVLKDRDGNGFKGNIKESRPKNLGGDKKPEPIIFYDRTNNTPAYFTSRNAGVEVAVGILELSDDRNSTKLKMFPPSVALEIKVLKTRMSAIARECKEFDIDVKDHQEFVKLSKKVQGIKELSKPVDFNVAIGQVYFGLNYQKKNYARSNRRSNEHSNVRY